MKYKKKTEFEIVKCGICGKETIYRNKRENYTCSECTMEKILLDRKTL